MELTVCCEVKYQDRWISTIGELRGVWPVLVADPAYTLGIPDEPVTCLCPVDFPASAAANGMQTRQREDLDWEIE
jgi:hypothetical protein